MSRFIINYRNALKRMVVLYDMVMLADFLQPNTKIIITLNCKDFISMVLTCENLYIINFLSLFHGQSWLTLRVFCQNVKVLCESLLVLSISIRDKKKYVRTPPPSLYVRTINKISN